MRHHVRGALLFITAVCVVAAGCGSGSKSSSPTSAATTATTATTAPTAPTGTAVAGTPYNMMFTETGLTPAASALGAIADGINSRGGIHGRPVRIIDCVDHGDANQATECGRRAVADPNMLAILGNGSTCSSDLLALLAAADMASVGDQAICPESFKSLVSFPFAGGGSFSPAEGAALAVKTFKQPSVIVTTVDVPAGREYPPLVQTLVTPVGGKVVASVLVPFTAADMAPYASQIASHTGILEEGNTVALGTRLGKALEQQGYDQPVIYNPTVWDAAALKSGFGDPKNAYLVSEWNRGSPGYQQFDSDMTRFDPSNSYRAGDALTIWLAANIVAREANKMSAASAKQIFLDLSSSAALNTFGLTAPLDFTKPGTYLGGSIPRIVDGAVALYLYQNGTFVQKTTFQEMLPH